ncbi:MFS general substrate transporter [Hypoxylon trugodes]|uniref:MFS general substrate transporter n=1 Tax=Hypoxylon trugodes TaxID=326681 RepID=UPI0021A15806|nr:MFS general substrate transporter [Hypoxylon trugodes]KAI1385681.1 MFS general substrate transporter [Hypoxylon trugodes]
MEDVKVEVETREYCESLGKGDAVVHVSEPGGGDGRQKDTITKKFLRIIWDSLDKSPEERRFIRKVDCWIMTYVCTAYCVKNLDQTNVINAYVSGMKEDLNMVGQEYNLLQTMFTIGYCLGNLPSQLAMTQVRPSIWLPSLELIWGFLVMAMAGAKDIRVLYALRFVIGFLEASTYPGVLTLLGNWYTPQELGKRSAIFIASSAAAKIFSGYLQAGLYSSMNGVNGLAAWQWLFIFDGIITIPVTVFGYLAIPDSPVNSKAKWLKPEEKAMAIARMDKVGRKPPAKLRKKIAGEIFKMWPVYLFSIVFASQLLGQRVNNYFTIYLKGTGLYTVEQVNLIPTGAYGLQIALTLIYAWLSDGIGKRTPSIVIAAGISVIGCIILSIYPEKNHIAMMVGWFLAHGQLGASALILTYINETLSFSNEHRLIVIGIVETFGFIMVSWGILLAYPSGEAPKFAIGYEMAAMFFCLEIVGITAVWFCNKKWKPSISS